MRYRTLIMNQRKVLSKLVAEMVQMRDIFMPSKAQFYYIRVGNRQVIMYGMEIVKKT